MNFSELIFTVFNMRVDCVSFQIRQTDILEMSFVIDSGMMLYDLKIIEKARKNICLTKKLQNESTRKKTFSEK
jgi:hypothetical protein